MTPGLPHGNNPLYGTPDSQCYSQRYLVRDPGNRLNARNTSGAHLYYNRQLLKNAQIEQTVTLSYAVSWSLMVSNDVS